MSAHKQLTAAQIKKCKCFRCGAQAEYQWSACADDNKWRPLCAKCDFQLNVLVIRFIGFKNWAAMLRRYAKRLGVKWSHDPKKKQKLTPDNYDLAA